MVKRPGPTDREIEWPFEDYDRRSNLLNRMILHFQLDIEQTLSDHFSGNVQGSVDHLQNSDIMPNSLLENWVRDRNLHRKRVLFTVMISKSKMSKSVLVQDRFQFLY
jgi:hypothetical protein